MAGAEFFYSNLGIDKVFLPVGVEEAALFLPAERIACHIEEDGLAHVALEGLV